MNIETTKKVLRVALNSKITPMVWGRHGIGKSQIVAQLGEAMAIEENLEFTNDPNLFNDEHFGLVDLRLGQMEVGDLIGMPVPDIQQDKTKWLKPLWFPSNPNSHGVLFLDECLSADTFVLTTQGRLTIKEIERQFLAGKKLFVKSFDNGKFVNRLVINVWNKGFKKVIKLHLNNTKTIQCTDNHLFLTEKGYKEAKTLKKGDKIVAYSTSKGKTATLVLNNDQLQVAYGAIIGDGCFCNRKNGSSYLSFIHSWKQKEYIEYKAMLFNAKLRMIEKNGYAQQKAYAFHTRLLNEFHGYTRKKALEEAILKINLQGLAILYCDDGSYNHSGKNTHTGYIHTHSLSKKEVQKLLNRLQAFGYKCSMYKIKKGFKTFYIIYIPVKTFKKFSKDIAKYIYPSMRYKIHPDYRNVKFIHLNSKFKNYGYFTFKKFGQVDKKKKNGCYVYDIEVDQTHNFVITSKKRDNGVVVHNCNRARLDVLQAVFQLVWDRRLATHILPAGWGIIVACNPAGSDYFVNELDSALMDRFLHIKLTPEVKEWVSWGKNTEKIGIDVTDFIEKYPEMLGHEQIEIPISIKPSPRSWELVSKILPNLPQEMWLEVCTGLVGMESSLPFIESLKKNLEKPIRADQILDAYKKWQSKIKKYSAKETARLDLLRMSCDDLTRVLKLRSSDGGKGITQQQELNIVAFLRDLPSDLSFSVIKYLVSNPQMGTDKFNEILCKYDDLYNKLEKVSELDK